MEIKCQFLHPWQDCFPSQLCWCPWCCPCGCEPRSWCRLPHPTQVPAGITLNTSPVPYCRPCTLFPCLFPVFHICPVPRSLYLSTFYVILCPEKSCFIFAIHSTLLCLVLYLVFCPVPRSLFYDLLSMLYPALSLQYPSLSFEPCSLFCTFCSLSCNALWAVICSLLYTLPSALYLDHCPVSVSLFCTLLSIKYTTVPYFLFCIFSLYFTMLPPCILFPDLYLTPCLVSCSLSLVPFSVSCNLLSALSLPSSLYPVLCSLFCTLRLTCILFSVLYLAPCPVPALPHFPFSLSCTMISALSLPSVLYPAFSPTPCFMSCILLFTLYPFLCPLPIPLYCTLLLSCLFYVV